MEEGGHYYTVYITSLAVGFKKELAYQHAVLSQMPDEVGWLDAANMHIKQCTPGIFPDSWHKEADLHGNNKNVPMDWRYAIEYGLHSLPHKYHEGNEKTSAFQRNYTTRELLREDPASLRFGLLLHRLGDSYAHSKMGHEQNMYTVTTQANCVSLGALINGIGHGHHGHSPDFPFLRPGLFMSYLQNLYEVLHSKASAPENRRHRREARTVTLPELSGTFRDVFAAVERRADHHYTAYVKNHSKYQRMAGGRGGYLPPPKSQVVKDDMKANWLIEEIRYAAARLTGVEMRAYSPEKQDARSLPQFLQEHPELNGLNINADNLSRAVRSMMPSQHIPSPPEPPPIPWDQMPIYP